MDNNLIKVKIVTPLKMMEIDDVYSIKVETNNGQREILPFSCSYVANVEISMIEIKLQDKTRHFAVGGGIIHFINDNNSCILTLSNFIPAEDIDVEKSKKAEEIALNKIKTSKNRLEHQRAEMNLKRALNEIMVKSTYKE